MEKKEFELPLNWVVRVTLDNVDELSSFKKNIHSERDSAYGYSFVNKEGLGVSGASNDQIITFAKFTEHVLKIKVEPVKIIKPLPFFEVLEYIGKTTQILYVQNNEGNIFRLGDMITGITSHSKQLGKMKITSFRTTIDTKNVCAVTKETKQYGIGIDKIQHIITPPVNLLKLAMEQCDKIQSRFDKAVQDHLANTETNLEKAQRLYVLGTVFHNSNIIRSSVVGEGVKIIKSPEFIKKGDTIFLRNGSTEYPNCSLWTIHNNNGWARIVKQREETLLEKAFRMYPIGTRYKEYGGNISTVVKQSFKQMSDTIIYGELDKGCLLYEGKWAEIVK